MIRDNGSCDVCSIVSANAQRAWLEHARHRDVNKSGAATTPEGTPPFIRRIAMDDFTPTPYKFGYLFSYTKRQIFDSFLSFSLVRVTMHHSLSDGLSYEVRLNCTSYAICIRYILATERGKICRQMNCLCISICSITSTSSQWARFHALSNWPKAEPHLGPTIAYYN